MKQWFKSQWAKEKAAAARIWFNILVIAVSLDQSLGVIVGFLMHPTSTELHPDESISSRCGRLGHRFPYKFWRWFIDTFLFSWWQGPNHCVNAYKKELTRYHFHPSMRSRIRSRGDDA